MTERIVTTEQERRMEWFDAIGFEDRYQITRCGLVRSKPRIVNSPVCGGRRMIGGKILKPASVRGYLAVQPVIGGKRRTIYIHRLLAHLFVENPDNKPCVNHIDGDKANNDIANLEWCTHRENMQHARATGLAPSPKVGPGETSPSSKLDDIKIRDIRERAAQGESHRSIAASYGVSSGTIGFITRRETWGHVE